MEEKMINAVKSWLETIMPAVVETLITNLTEEVLCDMGKEQGIHGPIVINLEEFRAPITAIHFFVMVIDDGMMLATNATIKGASDNITPEIGFDMFFPISDFAESIADEGHVSQMINRVLELYIKAMG